MRRLKYLQRKKERERSVWASRWNCFPGGIALCKLNEGMACTTPHIIMDAIYNVDIYICILILIITQYGTFQWKISWRGENKKKDMLIQIYVPKTELDVCWAFSAVSAFTGHVPRLNVRPLNLRVRCAAVWVSLLVARFRFCEDDKFAITISYVPSKEK
jgi:hypothetical protein